MTEPQGRGRGPCGRGHARPPLLPPFGPCPRFLLLELTPHPSAPFLLGCPTGASRGPCVVSRAWEARPPSPALTWCHHAGSPASPSLPPRWWSLLSPQRPPKPGSGSSFRGPDMTPESHRAKTPPDGGSSAPPAHSAGPVPSLSPRDRVPVRPPDSAWVGGLPAMVIGFVCRSLPCTATHIQSKGRSCPSPLKCLPSVSESYGLLGS